MCVCVCVCVYVCVCMCMYPHNMYTRNQIQDFHGKSSIQQEEVPFHQQIRLKVTAGTNKMLHLEAQP